MYHFGPFLMGSLSSGSTLLPRPADGQQLILFEAAMRTALRVTKAHPATLKMNDWLAKSTCLSEEGRQISRMRPMTISKVRIIVTKTGLMKRAASLRWRIPHMDRNAIRHRICSRKIQNDGKHNLS